MKKEVPTMKAWRVTWTHLPESVGIVAAETRGKALNRLRAAIVDAGWQPLWKDLRAVREPLRDAWAASLLPHQRWQCISPEFLPAPVVPLDAVKKEVPT